MWPTRLNEVLTLAIVLAVFVIATYLIVMAGGPSMTRVPTPNYVATPVGR